MRFMRTARKIMCLALALAAIPASALAGGVTVNTDKLYLRSSASSDSDYIAVLEYGDEADYIGESGGWVQVKYDGKTGYLSGDYVKIDSGSAQASTAKNTTVYAESKTGYAKERVNERATPSTSADIVKVIGEGDSLTVLGECGDWYQVKYSGAIGYVMKSFVRFGADGSASSGTSANTSSGNSASSATVYSTAKSGYASARLNVRSAAGSDASIVCVIDEGTALTLTGESGDWYAVKCASGSGYAAKAYVKLGLVSSGSATNYASAKAGKVDTDVNLRAAASTDAAIVEVLRAGASVTVTGESGSWLMVTAASGKTGYAASAYITIGGAAATTPVATTKPATDVTTYASAKSGLTTTQVNLRSGPSTSNSTLGLIDKGTALSATGESGDFYQVTVGAKSGYIAKDYVKLSADAPAGTTPGTTITGDSKYSATTTGIATTQVNLRSGPASSYSSLSLIDKNTVITLTGENGDWYMAAYKTYTGYVAKAYVDKTNGSTVAPAGEASPETYYVTGNTVNLRSSPSTSASVVKVLTYGASVTGYGTTDDWRYIEVDGSTGYVSVKYLSATKPATTTSNGSSANTSSSSAGVSSSGVVNIDWWTGGIQSIFSVGTVATVTDVDTGISWQVKRSGGSSHADVQPLTADDTAKMLRAYGGTWSWNRHAIWVTINGTRYAASMNGMPHGTGSITTNNFNGHHCIHFLNSRTHSGDRLDSAHQAAVAKAAAS